MKKEIAQFVYSWLICQKSKVERQKSFGLMNPLEIPECKWDNISMDFIYGFPNSPKGSDTIWVIIDKLTKLPHFMPIKISFSLQRLTEIYINNIVKLHGILSYIFSYRDPRFTSIF